MRTAPPHRRRLRPPGGPWPAATLAVLVLAGAVLAAILVSAGPARRTVRQPPISMFEDDQELVYQPLDPAGTAVVARTLSTLRSLGVQRIRVSLAWNLVDARSAGSRLRPHFDAADPADYPPGAWSTYDRLDLLATRYRIGLDFDANGPAPLWATRPGAPSPHYAAVWEPNASEFGQFVHAAGERYDGRQSVRTTRGGPLVRLPRVSFWSVWNEPNQPGWLAPQWRRAGDRRVAFSPRLYRALLDAAFAALMSTGHRPSTDTLLFGETAPEGCRANGLPCPGYHPAILRPIPPLAFLRRLYCLNNRYAPLRGGAAAVAGCSRAGGRAAFLAANPALFRASGYAHHPYEFNHPPNVGLPGPGQVGRVRALQEQFVPLADLPRLEGALDRIFAAYRVHRTLPIYLTEYGYESDPPNPCHGVPLSDQAAYLDEAQYMAASDPRVRALAQFLLLDSAPDTAYPPSDTCRYWSTFQTGLEFLDGRPKPALAAYRLPLWLPHNDRRGASVLLWGMVRPLERDPAGAARQVTIQWRPAVGGWRALRSLRAGPGGVFTATVNPPGDGRLRFAWRGPAGASYLSRSVAVAGG